MKRSSPITPPFPPHPEPSQSPEKFCVVSGLFLLCNIEEISAGENGLPWSPRPGLSQGDPWGAGGWRAGDDTVFPSQGPVIGRQPWDLRGLTEHHTLSFPALFLPGRMIAAS